MAVDEVVVTVVRVVLVIPELLLEGEVEVEVLEELEVES